MQISLCMIARDEEQLLPACLASVEGAVDEVVVVDTGSVDRTVACAEAAGARVLHHRWQDDFAAARNVALDAASGEWILLLDADERLAPGSGAALRTAVERGDFDCGMLPLHDAVALDSAAQRVLSGEARQGLPQLLPRLFRRDPDLRWQGIVHEAPADWMRASGRVFQELPVDIIHLGNVASFREQRGKATRNFRLLEQRCRMEPANALVRGYLARELVRAGDLERARGEVEQAWRGLLAEHRKAGNGPRSAGVQIASLRAYLAMIRGESERVLDTAARCLEMGVEHPNLVGMRAMVQRRRAQELAGPQRELQLAAAIDGLRWCLSMADRIFAEEVMAGLTGAVGATELGVAQLLCGRPDEALRAFEQALVEDSGHHGARLGVVEALLDCGRADEALSRLQPLLAEGGPDEWALAACICLAVGAPADAAEFLTTALKLGTPGSEASYRVERFARLAAAFEPA